MAHSHMAFFFWLWDKSWLINSPILWLRKKETGEALKHEWYSLLAVIVSHGSIELVGVP